MRHIPFRIFIQGLLSACFLAVFILNPINSQAQFTNGNIVVLQVGDGTAALSSAATPVFIKEYNTTTANQTTPVSTVTVPVTGAARLTSSGSATSEGHMTLSSDSSHLVLSGYDAAAATALIASSTSVASPRVVDTLSALAIIGRADTTQTAFSGNNIRCAVRNGGENYWASGGNTGLYYMGNLATSNAIYVSTTNLRVLNASNGKLYFSTASGLSRIGRINTQATSGPVTADTLITLGTGTTPSPYGFAVNAAETIVYVADDRAVASSGGIQKWTLSGSVWSLAYILSTGSTSGARSVIVDWSGTYPTLYAVTTSTTGTLIKITDSNATAPAIVLAVGGTLTAFRSVAFAPRPCIAPVLSATATPFTCAANGAVTLTTTGGTGPFTFAYTGPSTYSATTQNISNLATGTYNVTVTANGGCTSSIAAIVANNAILTATATPTGSTTRCQKDSVLLTANAGSGYHYQWKRNSTTLTNDTLQTYKAGLGGTYTVTITSGINCTATSPAVVITINSLPSTTVTPGSSTTFCTGSNVQLCAASGATGYQWRVNATNISGGNANCYTAASSGVYKVVITNSNGCTDSSTGVTVTAGPPPSAAITPSGTLAICQGSSIMLHTNNSSGLTYSWARNGITMTGSGTTDSTLVVYLAGMYTVTVSTGSISCTATSAPDTIMVNSLPATAISFLNGATFCGGDSVKVRAAAGNGNSYKWQITGFAMSASQLDSNYKFWVSDTITIPTSATFKTYVTDGAGCSDSSVLQSVTANPLPKPLVIYTGGILNTGTFSSYQWYLNGVVILNAKSATYTPMVNGNYFVKVTNSYGCSTTSTGYSVTGLGLGSTLAKSGVRIYPNPVQTILKIDAPFAVSAIVKDLEGRIVGKMEHSNQIDLESFPAGLYSISIYSWEGAIIGTQMFLKSAQ